MQAVQAATVGRSRRTGRSATSPRGSTRSARSPRAIRRSIPRRSNLTPELHGPDPGARSCASFVPGATLADALPAPSRDLLRDDRLRDRAHRERTVSACGCARSHRVAASSAAPLTTDEQTDQASRAGSRQGRRVRALHAQGVPRARSSSPIEGLDMTIPMIDELIQLAAAHGGREVVLGMAHRGRLNVLAHNLGRAYETRSSREFEGASTLEAVTTIPQGGTGDVKYHHGSQGSVPAVENGGLDPGERLESNPSATSSTSPRSWRARPAPRSRRRARARTRTRTRARRSPSPCTATRPSPARASSSETLNLQATRRLHGSAGRCIIIQNNQVGFTTDPGRRALHALGVGPRQGLRRADHPRQRRRPRGLHQRRAPRLRLPPGVRTRRPHRSHRLPALRAQRGRRARLHAARDGRASSRAIRGCSERLRRQAHAARGGHDAARRSTRSGAGGLGSSSRRPALAS